MTERPKPTPEITANPTETLAALKQNPAFENRLMASFVESKVETGRLQASMRGETITVHGPLEDSPLSLRLVGSNEGNHWWKLQIQNLEREPDISRDLASVHRQNMIGMSVKVGALEGGYHVGLSHPDAADVLRVLAELSDMDRQTRNIRSILEGYPSITDPVAQAYIKLIGDFSDPSRLRVSEGYVKDPPEQVAGVIDEPRLHMPSTIILNLHGRSMFSRDKDAFCYVHWFGDRGEKFEYPRQTVFGFDRNNGFSYSDGTEGLKRGTARQELSDRMLDSLNEGFVPSTILGRRVSELQQSPQQV